LQYRPEIDGLRAIAVLPVILFHAGFQWFQGGYIGVDVFFVISGYLITTLLIEDMRNNRFSLTDFYERRAKRILPALFFVIIVCIPFAMLWMLPKELIGFAKSMTSVSIFSSNIFFWQENDYFSSISEEMPLLHTWSLAVEEQYYLLFPIFLSVFWRLGLTRLFWFILGLSLFSLLVSEWSSRYYASANFYLLHTRAWELLSGSIVAIFIHQNGMRRSNFFSILGLAAIVASVVVYDHSTPFPSIYALLPVGGTLLVILYSGSNTLVARLLSLPAVVAVGLISYSMYLWHQPIFAFARIRSMGQPEAEIMALLVVLSFILSVITWKYIEIFGFSALGLILISLAGGILQGLNGLPNRDGLEITSVLDEIPNVRGSYCHNDGRRTVEEIKAGDFCLIGEGEVSYAIIGDSHAGAIFDYADEYLSRSGSSSIAVSGGFCAPLMNGFEAEFGCYEMMSAAFNGILTDSRVKQVIMLAEWANYTQGFRDNDVPIKMRDSQGKASDIKDNEDVFMRSLGVTVQKLTESGKEVFIVLPVPEFSERAYDVVQKAIFLDYANSLDAAVAFLPATSNADYHSRNRAVLDIFYVYQESVTLIPIKQLFCGSESCKQYDQSKQLLYSDTNHVNYFGAGLIVNEVFDRIRSANKTP
jgi:peptidoglycan/LPS O-acetylase OafA/YrhL